MASTSNNNNNYNNSASTNYGCPTTTRPILINHAQSASEKNYHQSEISIIPTRSSSQLIFSSSSIITTQAKSSHPNFAKHQRRSSKSTASSSSSPLPSSSSPFSKLASHSTLKTAVLVNGSNKLLPTTNHLAATSQSASLVPTSSSSMSCFSTTDIASNLNNTNTVSKQSTSSSLTSIGHQSPSATVGQAVTAKLMDMGKKLLDATREGLIDQVRQLVVNSGAPFTSDSLGTTALHLAAQHGHGEIAEILLRGGVNRDARTKLERTALHLAAQSGSIQVVDLLLNHGSDVNARDMLKMTPLHWAVERRHVRVVERLLLSGADINAKNKFQLTPVEIAQNSESYEVLNLFKVWSTAKNGLNGSPMSFGCNLNGRFNESHVDMLDGGYHLALTNNSNATTSRASMLDIDEPCIDLVDLVEWEALKFEPDFFLSNDDEDESKVEYLMKIVDKLKEENLQLRQKVEQLSTTSQ